MALNDICFFLMTLNDTTPHFPAFQSSKAIQGYFCNQMHKSKTLIPLHISYLRTIFQHSTGKSLLSA